MQREKAEVEKEFTLSMIYATLLHIPKSKYIFCQQTTIFLYFPKN